MSGDILLIPQASLESHRILSQSTYTVNKVCSEQETLYNFLLKQNLQLPVSIWKIIHTCCHSNKGEVENISTSVKTIGGCFNPRNVVSLAVWVHLGQAVAHLLLP